MASQGPLGWGVPLVLTLLSVQGLREFAAMAECKGLFPQKGTLFVAAVCYIFGLYAVQKQELWRSQLPFDEACLFTVLFFLLLIEGFKKQCGGENICAFKTLAISLAGFIYVPWCLGFTMKILYFFENGRGLQFLIFLLLVSKSTDIFAYLAGKALGTHKLADKISPKKTVEGSLGGLVGATALALVSQKTFLPDLSVPQALLFGFTVSAVSQLGDLAESLLKRDAGCKDSGSLICGMGGVLDLLDSILFTAPFLYFLMCALV